MSLSCVGKLDSSPAALRSERTRRKICAAAYTPRFCYWRLSGTMARRINSPYWQTKLPLTLNQATLEFISQFPILFKGYLFKYYPVRTIDV